MIRPELELVLIGAAPHTLHELGAVRDMLGPDVTTCRFDTAEAAKASLTAPDRPRVALVDEAVVEDAGGLDPEALDADAAVVLGHAECRDRAAAGLRDGFTAWVVEPLDPVEVAGAVQAALDGAIYLSPSLLSGLDSFMANLLAIQPVDCFGHLTDREQDVLRLMSLGLSNNEIADELVVSVATVRTHALSLFQKLGVDNRTQAAALAHNGGLAPA